MRVSVMKSLMPALAAACLATPVAAAVVEAQPNGFQVRSTVMIKAPAAKVYEALGQVGRWWSPAHTYSGDASNMTLEAKAGGCWCESLPDGGSVQHGIVVYAAPATALRTRGGIGPLQSLGADGTMEWEIKASGASAIVIQTYTIGGYANGGLGKWARSVDEVLDEQLKRLKAYLETGKPGP